MLECNGCGLMRVPVDYVLIESSKIAVIGESPGSEEELKMLPFVGESGKLLTFGLQSYAEIDRQQVSILNATKCRIPQELKVNKTILWKEIQKCRTFLKEALQKIRPSFVLVLGEIALSQLIGKWVSIGRYRGRPIKSEEFDCIIFPTYHPAVVLRNGGIKDTNHYWKMWSKDLADFGRLVRGEETATAEEKDYQPFRVASEFSNSKFIAIDAEWDENGNLLVFSISNGNITRYITQDMLNPTVRKMLFNLLRKPKVYANRPVDERILRNYLSFPSTSLSIDVFNLAKLLEDNLHVNLENIAELIVGETGLKDKIKKVNYKVDNMALQDLIEYNCNDSRITAKAFKKLVKKLKEDSRLFNYWKNFIIPAEEMLASIGLEGFPIDEKKLELNRAIVEVEAATLEAKLLLEIPVKVKSKHRGNLKLSRNKLLSDILYGRDGFRLKPPICTPTGEPSVSEEALNHFQHIPWVADLLKWKKLNKLLNTFFSGLQKNMKNGRIYPSTVLYATVTGRTACFNPNIQQIPRQLPMVEKLKELFAAPKGWLIGTRDLSQSEIRIMGWMAGEKKILQALRHKEDLHTKTASMVLGKPVSEITKQERQIAKSVNFGFLYGAQASTFVEVAKNEYGLEISLEEAKKLREKYFESYPSIPVFHEKCILIAKTFGYIRSPLGRVRRLPHIYSNETSIVKEAERQAINFPIQSFSSDLALIGMFLFWKEIKDKKAVKLLWFIHDSIFFMCQEKMIDTYMELLKECMEKRAPAYILKKFGVKVGYPVESDGKVGPNWALLEDYK